MTEPGQRSDQGTWRLGKMPVAAHTGQRGWKWVVVSAQSQLGRDPVRQTDVRLILRPTVVVGATVEELSGKSSPHSGNYG